MVKHLHWPKGSEEDYNQQLKIRRMKKQRNNIKNLVKLKVKVNGANRSVANKWDGSRKNPVS